MLRQCLCLGLVFRDNAFQRLYNNELDEYYLLRRKLILVMAAKAKLVVLNTVSTPTFQRPDCEKSIPDLRIEISGVINERVASSGKLSRERPPIHRVRSR